MFLLDFLESGNRFLSESGKIDQPPGTQPALYAGKDDWMARPMNPSQRLSDWIADDLAARIATNAPLPFRLNSLELARHYGSSRTPVNRAIEVLVGRGVLVKHSNGRLARPEPLPDIQVDQASSVQASSVQASSVQASSEGPELKADGTTVADGTPGAAIIQADWRQAVREQMVLDVVRLSLQGQANFLRENVWTERLGVGRGILRLLLSELAGQGLVVHVPRRGWQVRPFDERDMLQYLEIREVLELAALDLAQGRLVPQRLREMLAGNPAEAVELAPEPSVAEALDRLPVPAPPAPSAPLNNDIHGYLVQQSGNRYIADFFQQHSDYYSQLFQMAAVQTGWRNAMAQQHRLILTALLEQDWPSARVALAEHIRAQRPVVRDLLRQVRSSEEPPVAR